MNVDTNPKPPKARLLLGVSVVFVLLAAAGSIVLYATRGWDAPASVKNLQNPVPTSRDSIAMGTKNYSIHCESCHGERGDGKGQHAEKLSVAPSDFTDAQAMIQITDGELFWKISRGRRPMPSFENKLTAQERWQLVDYIRTLAQKTASGVAPAASSPRP